jgi:opacity protein-like surface antigen
LRTIASVVLSALTSCATTLPTLASAAPGEQSQSPPSSAQPGLLARLFPLTGTADWISGSYYVTSQAYYDIEVEAIDAGRAWRLGSVLELQGRLGAFHSEGERLDAPWLGSENSRTTGVTFGGGTRLYALQRPYARLFVEGSVEILYTPGGEQFPAGGTGVNAFLRVGGGVQCQITPRLALEAHYEYAHVSNGAGSVEQNPMWNGRGGGLTLRRWL